MTVVVVELFDALRSIGVPHDEAVRISRARPLDTDEQLEALCDEIRAAGARPTGSTAAAVMHG